MQVLIRLIPALFLLFLATARGEGRPFGAYVQRSMTLLATSTPEHRNTVRVLFYGQSITKQEWWRAVADDLRKRFPDANLVIENRSIGGYDSPRLIRTLPHDVYPFYPDLVIFYDYGPEPEYEQMIRDIRSHTTAEIAVQTDHLTWLPQAGEPGNPAEVKRKESHDRHSFEWLPQLAEKYGLELIEQRRPWEQYLRQNHLRPSDLLKDGVHLNARGNALMAELVTPHLIYDPRLTVEKWKDLTESYPAKWNRGRFKLEFDGNRVNVAINGKGTARVLIDGKPPSQIPELYAITRPSDTWSVDWPALNHVSSEKPLLVEDWTVRVTEKNEADTQFRFTVEGSKTGPDGEGSSLSRFVSRSGRVVIEPRDWEGIKRARDLKQVPMPVGFEIKWQVKPMFSDPVQGSGILAQGLANGRHTLEMIAEGKDAPVIQVTVYRPPLE